MRYEEGKTKDGYFGSSTPSSKKPFKETTGAEVKKNGGAVCIHKGYGKQTITQKQANKTEEIIISNKCPHCKGRLVNKSFIKRPIIDSVLLQTKKYCICAKRSVVPVAKKR